MSAKSFADKIVRDQQEGDSVEKKLAKIETAKFGCIWDRDFLFGLQLGFAGKGWGVGDGGIHVMNMSEMCKWTDEEKQKAAHNIMKFTYELLKEANVQSVDKLVGIPVEVTLDGNLFKEFRVLTEVL